MNGSPSGRGLTEGLLRSCLLVLVAALMLRTAVGIVEGLWPVLAIIAGTGLVLKLSYQRWRERNSRW